jgi:hypothetical protein
LGFSIFADFWRPLSVSFFYRSHLRERERERERERDRETETETERDRDRERQRQRQRQRKKEKDGVRETEKVRDGWSKRESKTENGLAGSTGSE